MSNKKVLDEIFADNTATLDEIFNDTTKKAEPKKNIGEILTTNAKEAYNESFGAGMQGLNTALLGLPRAVLNKISPNVSKAVFPEQKTFQGKVARGVSELTGFTGGAASKIGAKAAEGITKYTPKVMGMLGKNVAKKTIPNLALQKASKEALQYGIAGLVQTPEQQFTDWQDANLQRGVQGIAGAAAPFIFNAPKLINLGGRKTAQRIAEKADMGFEAVSKQLSNKYDDLFANIKGEVTPNNTLQAIDDAISAFPEKGDSKTLTSIIDKLTAKDTITAQELHNLKASVKKLVPPRVWSGKADANPIDNAYEKIYYAIHDDLERIGGVKYKGLTAEYKNFKNSEKLAKKVFYRNDVPSNEALKNIYDVPTEQATRQISSQLPNEQKFAEEFEAWRKGQALKNLINPRSWLRR